MKKTLHLIACRLGWVLSAPIAFLCDSIFWPVITFSLFVMLRYVIRRIRSLNLNRNLAA